MVNSDVSVNNSHQCMIQATCMCKLDRGRHALPDKILILEAFVAIDEPTQVTNTSQLQRKETIYLSLLA